MILKNGIAFINNELKKCDILIEEGKIKEIKNEIDLEDDLCIDLNENHIFPGLIDVHTHLREPGFEYKETIETGSMAALSRWLHINLCNAKFKPSSRF